jgi:aldehyde dehydrogenase (NAD+)
MMETDTDLRRHDLLIDGKRLPPGTGEYSVDINPATEEPIAMVAQGSARPTWIPRCLRRAQH